MNYSVKDNKLVIEIELQSENDIYDWFLQADLPVKLSDIERLKFEYKKSRQTIRGIDVKKSDEIVSRANNDVYHWLVKHGYTLGTDTEQLSIELKEFFDAKKNDVIHTNRLYRIMTVFDAFGLNKNIKLVNIVPNSNNGSIEIVKSFPALNDIKPAEFVDYMDDLFGKDPSILTNPNGISGITAQDIVS